IERFQDLGLFDEVIAPKFTIMGHPVDTKKFTPQPKRSEQDGILRVLVISRMVPEKGLLYILEAMNPVLRSRSNLQLQFLGSGAMQSLLKTEVEERGLREKVMFLNPVPHREIPKILGGADLFVNHAVSTGYWEEYFGVVNLEAMSCALPCLLTASGGIPYAIREKDVAVFVEERNIIQLREAITRLLDSEQERRKMGKRARDYVEAYYALPIIAQKYHRMLQQGFEKMFRTADQPI
ncbi:MAG: glycosyltransferase family 4 protein, partial [Coleofasciculus sp. Co-bin14]|nr:glycosyltransferase family 4 protein [Coleofasciculus sp. Co-bin14]